MATRKRILLVTAGVAGALLLAIVVMLANLHWFRGPIERAVTAATGREAHLRGELRLSPWFPPGVIAGDASLANASWSDEAQMFSAKRIAVQPYFWRLVRGEFAFRNVESEGLRLRIERNAKGVGNWEFDSAKPEAADADAEPPSVLVDRLVLKDARFRIREPGLKTDLSLVARTEDRDAGAGSRLRITGEGRYRAAPFDLKARLDVPNTIDAELAVDLDVDARAGATRLRVAGKLPAALTTLGASVDLKLSGDNLGDLYHLSGIALPETPPYSLSGRLGWKGRRIDWNGFDGRIGDSEIRGDARLELRAPRPRITAKLRSSLLDFDDLGSLFGVPPATGDGETASPEQQQTKAQLASRGRVLPDSPFDFGKLNAIDADVTLDAERINAPKLPVRALSAHVKLKDGKLAIDPLQFTVAEGAMKGHLAFDSRRDPLGYDLLLDIEALKLAQLVPQAEVLRDAVGRIDGHIALAGTGNSVAAMFAGADGRLQVIMGEGEVSNLLLELAGLDVAEALKFLLGKDRKVSVRCAYVDFAVKQGVAGAEAFALDTADTALLGRGSIDLREEKFDLTLLQRPKDRSLITLRTPLRIGGQFLDPSFGVAPGPLILRGAAVAALASIAPPAALLALVEPGTGRDQACGPGERAPTAEERRAARRAARD
ncbi:MAG: AsmA family protein [Steroidobacteraceae bacterium]